MSETQLKKLVYMRSALKGTLTKAFNMLKDGTLTLHELEVRESVLSGYLDQFRDLQFQIENLEISKAEEKPNAENNELSDFEDKYFEVLSLIRSQKSPPESKSTNEHPNSFQSDGGNSQSPSTSTTHVKLPTIKLPSFSGSYEDWLTFHDTFNSLIHSDTSLPDIQKFHYLKSALSGDAAMVLTSLSVCKENYQIAWEMLKERFDNKRIIVQEHLKGIFGLPYMNKENHSELRLIVDGLLKHTRALKSLDRPVDSWDDLLVYILTRRLDSATIKEWDRTLTDPSSIPTLEEFMSFLKRKCQSLETLHKASSQIEGSKPKSIKSSIHVVTSNISCPICSNKHLIYNCKKFTKLPVEARFSSVKSKNLCLNCLKPGHRSNECTSSSCKICKRRHNTLLHIAQDSGQSQNENANATISNHATNCHTEVLLSTAVIYINDIKGKTHECRALLDSGSQSNFIVKALADRLGIKQDQFSIPVMGINQASTKISKITNVRVSSRINAFQTNLKCLVIDQITSQLPTLSLDKSAFEIPKNIKLADPDFNISRNVDMLIGVDLFWKLMCIGQIKGTATQPVIQKTHFGWILAGTISPKSTHSATTVCNLLTNEALGNTLEAFWNIEDLPQKRAYTMEEISCETHFRDHFKRNEDGRFVVRLPFKENCPQLGESYNTALKRFYNLERRLNKNPQLKEQYSKFVREYEELGHMKQINADVSAEDSARSFYLPHHAVEKLDSTTTKLRVVFDGSCQTSTGASLNDCLLVGPTLQQDLFSIVIRFRTPQIALTADIAKMYRQILVDDEDTNFQRILWRSNPQERIKTYNLCTVTYGTSSASFLAIRALQQLAHEEREEFPLGSAITMRDFYVDDLITGSNSVEEGRNIVHQCTTLLQRGGFQLRKWHSNTPDVFKEIDVDTCEDGIQNIDMSDTTKALGLSWNTRNDTLFYRVQEKPLRSKITKRIILSIISQLFDPLGLLGPIIIVGKLFMQDLWKLKLDWDESLPIETETAFSEYKNQISRIEGIKIPRKVLPVPDCTTIELHGFCDASQAAYGACVYVRCITQDGNVVSNLLCSKSRVAPIKSITIPRLELCGALLLARLTERITSTINIQFDNAYYWTDSTVALAWIRSKTRQWKTFVINRVSEIQELTNSDQWFHVRSEDNPADLISRGSTSHDLLNSTLWWHGPGWLMNNMDAEISRTNKLKIEEPLPEEKTITACTTVRDTSTQIFSKFSTLNKLTRVTGYCMRFINNVRARTANNRNQIITGTLTLGERRSILTRLIKLIQQQQFPQDLKNLKKTGSVASKSKILNLNPFLDEEGIIRVGGRIILSQLNYSHKHPIVLPARHEFTSLVIDYFHKKQLHAGVQGTMAAIRSEYWPLNLRNTTKNQLRKCITCFKANPRSETYKMSDLPCVRVGQARPFINSGVDFCGPFNVRESKRRNSKVTKVYVGIFICLSTKAVHIETVGDLSSEAFISALKRFMSRRGKVAKLYSDNGTNFVGANKELQRLCSQFASDTLNNQLSKYLTDDSIEWHFIPPRSPHFGGIWEAAVKSTKHHLRRVAGNALLTLEQLQTLLIQIEAILNSRPLTPLSNDPNDPDFLTPSHFLIGDCLTALPEPNLSHVQMNRLSHWQHVERLKQHFWTRWHKEYLSHLQQRTKWKTTGPENIAVGKLVVIKEEHLPPARWATGRITQVHPGNDGVIRAVTLRVKDGMIKRSVTKLCALPLD